VVAADEVAPPGQRHGQLADQLLGALTRAENIQGLKLGHGLGADHAAVGANKMRKKYHFVDSAPPLRFRTIGLAFNLPPTMWTEDYRMMSESPL
jgi:hypothetical protein